MSSASSTVASATPAPVAAASSGNRRQRSALAHLPFHRTTTRTRTATTQAGDAVRCWICYDDDDPTRVLAQFCSCSLVAHAECVLRWVSSNHGREPSCPVCNVAYSITIAHKSTIMLPLLSFVANKWNLLSVVVGTGGLVSALMLSLYEYAKWSIRTFAGEQTLLAIIRKSSASSSSSIQSWSHYVNLPLIPITLILSRTPLLNSFFAFYPLALFLSTTGSTASLTSQLTSAVDNIIATGTIDFSLPPSPLLTVCALPFLRILYLRSRRFIFESVFRISATSSVFGREDHAVIAEADRARGAAGNINEQDEEAPLTTIEIKAIARFIAIGVEALLFPAASAMVGSALFALAVRPTSSIWSRSLLGIDHSMVHSRGAASGGLGGLGLGLGLGLFRSKAVKEDPLWWRNLIGAALVLLGRDTFQIVGGVLRKRERNSRKIVGRSVRG